MRHEIVLCAVLLGGCTHVTHGAYVREGWSVGAELGGSSAQIRPHTDLYHYEGKNALDFQLRVGDGWRYDDRHGVSLTLMVPVSSSSPVGSLYTTSFDAYWQLVSGPLDLGVGALASFASPGLYVEAGRRYTNGAELSGGLQLLLVKGVPTYALFGLLTFAATERVRMGLWADYHEPFGVVADCDENCGPDDDIDRWFAGGVTVSLSFGRPDATTPEPVPAEMVPAGSVEPGATARGADAVSTTAAPR